MITPPLQPGQYWRTRSGSIVYVDSIMPEWAGISLPVIVIWKRDSGGHNVVFYHRSGCYFVNRESPYDLITYLPDCDSLDWVPPKYPAYVMSSNGSDHYAYIRRDSDTSGEIVYKSGHAEPYVWHEGSQKLIADGVRVYITKEQAESLVQKPVPPESPKYYKASTESFGYFRVDSKDSYFWITPDGREVKQCGSPDILKKHPFVEITKDEAETRVKRSDAPETVVEVNDSVLSMLNIPTALLINGEIAGLITEVEFGLMNDEIRKKTPVARQYLGVSVSPPEVLQPPVQTSEHPCDWVVQDRVPARADDEYRWSDWPADEWRKVTPSMERQCVSSGAMSQWKNGVTLSVRCRRHALPPDPSPKPPYQNTAPEVYSMIREASLINDPPSPDSHSSHRPVQLLIRICSAQQSMLSELSAQVDALRSQITSGEPR